MLYLGCSFNNSICNNKKKGDKMKTIKIGVDVGNSDTKTQHCVIASGFKRYDIRPEIATAVLEYDGAYYVPDINERMPYVADKTQHDQCLILTLLGIAEEILYVVKENDNDNIQKGIKDITSVKLGLGLPPGHFTALSKRTLNYYNEKLGGTVSFKYKRYDYSFTIDEIKIYPQDFVAVYKNVHCNTAKKKRYYICGIGGGTVDVVPVINGSPDANNCFSLEKGTRVMYRQICADIQRQFGEMLDENLVEDVLRNEETSLPGKYIQIIKDDAKKHYEDIIKGCSQQGVKLSLYPVVFFGGGGLLFKPYIEEDHTLTAYEILADINANAKAYAICLK